MIRLIGITGLKVAMIAILRNLGNKLVRNCKLIWMINIGSCYYSLKTICPELPWIAKLLNPKKDPKPVLLPEKKMRIMI